MKQIVFSSLLLLLSYPSAKGQIPPLHDPGSLSSHSASRSDSPYPTLTPYSHPSPPETSGSVSPPPGSTVSTTELHIPSAAVKQLQLSQRDFQSGKLRDSIKHLQKALHIYPNMADAHQDLGLCYYRLHEYDKALAEFQSASVLDAHLVQPAISLSGMYFVLARYPEAEASARHALKIDPQSPGARYLLGRALAAEDYNTPEAMELLQKSTHDYPVAQLVLANVLLKRNATAEAVAELRQYVQRPEIPQNEKDRVTCIVEELTHPPANLGCSLQ